MALSIKNEEGRVLVKIDEKISVYEVSELHKELSECLEKNDAGEIDLSGVTDCDTAGVQLFYSAIKTARINNKAFKIVEASEAVHQAVTRTGFDPEEIFSP